ncbi:MAG: hypothetical protein DRI34_05670 [Deltaproteobacteria bacterium]|nr:MAG: hypothetical protein DRI34_05670 [Deltaproteobacteria bacterium]
MRRYSNYVLLLFVLSFACSFDLGPVDPHEARNGEFGRLRFDGGGGCSDSTTVAVGATARITLEPLQQQSLPVGLRPRSSNSGVIAAAAGSEPDQVELTALEAGEALVEILADGEVYDRLGFSAEPAYSADYTVTGEVFSGGTLAVKVDEIYGACGRECPLIGGDFIRWSSEPDQALALYSYQDRLALLVAGAPGKARIIGREPTAGRALVDYRLEILPADSEGIIRCLATVAYPGDPDAETTACPRELRVDGVMLLELHKELADGRLVPLAGRDVQWSVVGPQGVVRPWPETAAQPPVEGPVYQALAPGRVSLVALVGLTGDALSIDLTVTE